MRPFHRALSRLQPHDVSTLRRPFSVSAKSDLDASAAIISATSVVSAGKLVCAKEIPTDGLFQHPDEGVNRPRDDIAAQWRPIAGQAASNPLAHPSDTNQAQIAEVVERLRQTYECTHLDYWRRFKGYRLSEFCNKSKKDTVGECRNCFVVASYYYRMHGPI